jgi:hypothetical protein
VTRWLAFLFCPFASGCLAFGYPNVTATAPATVDTSEVRAFRVTSETTFGGAIIAGYIQLAHDIEEIPITPVIASQSDASFCYWTLVFPFGSSHHRQVGVVLYRPGYETVELPGRPWWQFPQHATPARVVWKEAPDLAAQAKALEPLLSAWHSFSSVSNLSVLRFLAGEYERLVQRATTGDATAVLREELAHRLTEVRERIAAVEKRQAERAAK